MPRSRSRSMESSSCGRWSRGSTAPVISRMRSASVDFPWSMWAMIEKLRMLAAGAATDSSMAMESDMEVVRAVFAAFTARDIEAVLAHSSPDVEFSSVTGEHAGRTDPYLGHDGLRQYFRDLADVWDELRIVPRDFRQEGDRILVTGRVSARSPARIVAGST